MAARADTGDASKMDSIKKENRLLTAEESPSKTGSSIAVKLCNYCGQQGNLRCTRCKRTCYCSVACQTEDWKAHRHVCKPSTPESTASVKTQEPVTSSAVSGPKPPAFMVRTGTTGQVKRVYLRDLPRNEVTKGTQLQASVMELRNPGKFFIHIQSVEMVESLCSVTVALQKAYAGSLGTEYLPESGELCAVKYSQDQSWYRGVVQSVDASYKTASVFYIDFGNEEVVTLDRIKALCAGVDPVPPCAVACRVAGAVAVTGTWTEECCICIRQLVAGKSLPMTVMDTPDDTGVWAVDVSLPTIGKKLRTFLVEQGYAVEESRGAAGPNDQDIDSILSAALENFRRSSGGKQENMGASSPEPLTQGLGDSFSAMVTHVQSPSELICQKLENASAIQELQVGLREHCCRTPASGDFKPAPGSVCCSQFTEDHQWYRAKVLGYSSETRICVGYIDFGNSEEVDLSHLRPLSALLAALPMQAIPCVLAGVKPVTDRWSDEAILLLKKIVCNRLVRVEIVGDQHGTALVTLTDENSDPQTSMAELLLATGHALPDDTAPPQAAVHAPTAPPQTDKTDKMRESTAARPPMSPLEWSCAELPYDGQTVELVISVMKSVSEFYCHRYNAEDIHALKELSAQILKHCQTESSTFTPTVGEPCCAMFAEDGSWYRCMVLRLAPDGMATVYFVDYGNTSEVEQMQMRAIPPRFLKHPFQAIRCWLAGVEPPLGQWGGDVVRRFRALSVGKQLQARVCSITERGFGVELLSGGQNIAALLVGEELAKASGDQEPSAAALETAGGTGGTFPVDWKTVELQRNKPFQPRVAAIVSPSLFYILREDNMDMRKLPALMVDLAAHCSTPPKVLPSNPQPGAACCAQLPGDKKWYRAVVLEIAGCDVDVLCADYGNVEKVPSSNIVPIADRHLLLPFQIVRCALSGKEHFPSVWSQSVLEMFSSQLRGKAHASVDHFDGTYNLLVLTVTGETTPRANAGCTISQSTPREKGTATKLGGTSRAPAIELAEKMLPVMNDDTVGPVGNLGPVSVEMNGKEQPQPDTGRAATDGSPAPDGKCCCSHLIQKIDRLEELILQMVKQMGASPLKR